MVGAVAFVTIKGWVPYLWSEWITSVDHKRIGIMYMLLAAVMLLRGFTDAIMMRSQQALAFQSQGYLPPEHYNQIFAAHGTIMIFFVAMAFVIGLMNFVVPLQLGVRDVAFPTLNSVSFWLTATGALLINISLVVGEFSSVGWLPFPPLSELTYSPGVGVDYYLWAIQISGVGTLMTGVNFVTTILKLHAPGMTYMRMPIFCWTALRRQSAHRRGIPGADRDAGDADARPLPRLSLLHQRGRRQHDDVHEPHLGLGPPRGLHPHPAGVRRVLRGGVDLFGKTLFGYRSMVLATLAICVVSFMVWLHHFFTMGVGANVNAMFAIASMIIAVPTGVKIYNWLFTMYGGRIVYATPMLWAVGFMVTFIIGGLTGVLVAVPPADFMVHNSLFLVAHFHNVIIGGVLFGAFAGYTFWFPKAFGFRLHEGWGKAAFWCWLIGFYLAFAPLYVLGLMGMTRRMQHYDVPEWRPWLLVAALGAAVILAGIVCQIAQLVVSIRHREELRDLTGDPWMGRSLEWSTSSPPPTFNFAVLPVVEDRDDYWRRARLAERGAGPMAEPIYKPIEMPRNSATGFVCAFFATFAGFGMIWHIWWLVIVALVGAFATFVVFAWRDRTEYEIPAEEVARIDRANRRARGEALAPVEALSNDGLSGRRRLRRGPARGDRGAPSLPQWL